MQSMKYRLNKVLADTCKNILKDENKTIHVLPNLPLAELEQIARLPITENLIDEGSEIKIALTSGTLSHKQILKEDLPCTIRDVEKLFKSQTISR